MDLDTITRQCPYGDMQLTYYEVGQRSTFPTIILIHGTGGNTDKHFSYIFVIHNSIFDFMVSY